MIPRLLIVAICGLMLTVTPARAALFDLGTFQDASGAVTTFMGGDTVEPYFANKALLTAFEGGMDITTPGYRYIDWAIDMQRVDGRFDRYCRHHDGSWWTCDKADSDDATLALWLQLLYSIAPNSGLPAEWKESAKKAQSQLNALYDKDLGIYHISPELPVGLLMDNLEVYDALVAISNSYKRFGNHTLASHYRNKAKKLQQGIQQVFWNEDKEYVRVTTQERDEYEFYPDKVAELYFILSSADHPSGVSNKELFASWMDRHRYEWLNASGDHFPWGIVSIASLMVDKPNTAFCWQQKAVPYRYSSRWNVLEEASLQRVQKLLREMGETAPDKCEGVV